MTSCFQGNGARTNQGTWPPQLHHENTDLGLVALRCITPWASHGNTKTGTQPSSLLSLSMRCCAAALFIQEILPRALGTASGQGSYHKTLMRPRRVHDVPQVQRSTLFNQVMLPALGSSLMRPLQCTPGSALSSDSGGPEASCSSFVRPFQAGVSCVSSWCSPSSTLSTATEHSRWRRRNDYDARLLAVSALQPKYCKTLLGVHGLADAVCN